MHQKKMSSNSTKVGLRLFALLLVTIPLLEVLKTSASKFDWKYLIRGSEYRTFLATNWPQVFWEEILIWVVPLSIGLTILNKVGPGLANGAKELTSGRAEGMRSKSSPLWAVLIICAAGAIFIGRAWYNYQEGVESGYEQMATLISLGYGGPYPTAEDLRTQGVFEFSVLAVAGGTLIILSRKLARLVSHGRGS